MKVDDSYGFENAGFIRLEADAAIQFLHKPRLTLGSTAVRFKGLKLCKLYSQDINLGKDENIDKIQVKDDRKGLVETVGMQNT